MLAALYQRDRRRALALSQLVRDLADRLGDAVRLPATDIPRHPVAADADPAAAEACAAQVRAVLGIPPGPVPDVVSALERHGMGTSARAEGGVLNPV